MSTSAFDPAHSPLSLDPAKINRLAVELESRLGHNAKIVGILEIGSFAKHEGVPCSDSDLRVYAESPDAYFYQTRTNNQEEIRLADITNLEKRAFAEQCGNLPWETYEWFNFNGPNSSELSNLFGLSLEFGVADVRFTEFRLKRIDRHCLEEHQMILQSNIIFDPNGILERWQNTLGNVFHQTMGDYYQERYLNHPASEIYLYLKPSEMDAEKVKKSGQILWIKWAVRAIRDAVCSKVYQKTGRFIFKKDDILDFCMNHLPQHFGLIKQLYDWKTDPVVRSEMVAQFVADPTPFYEEFRTLTPKVEKIIEDVNSLIL